MTQPAVAAAGQLAATDAEEAVLEVPDMLDEDAVAMLDIASVVELLASVAELLVALDKLGAVVLLLLQATTRATAVASRGFKVRFLFIGSSRTKV